MSNDKQEKPKQVEKPKVDKAILDAAKAEKQKQVATNQTINK